MIFDSIYSPGRFHAVELDTTYLHAQERKREETKKNSKLENRQHSFKSREMSLLNLLSKDKTFEREFFCRHFFYV